MLNSNTKFLLLLYGLFAVGCAQQPVNPAIAPHVVAETMNFVMSAFGKRIL